MRRRLALLPLLAACLLVPPASAAASAKLHGDDFRHDRKVTVKVAHAHTGKPIRSAAARTGPWRVAVLLVNFADSGAQPWTAAQVSQTAFVAPNSTAAYYATQSWGKVTVSGDVYGWYTLPAAGGNCDVDAWASQARTAATAAGVNLNAYDSVAYAFPYQSSCGWAGLAEMPGRQFWLNGDVSTRVFAHELGHNMGVHHAGTLSCTADGAAVQMSPNCSFDEYGDPFDVMGSRARQMGGWHLQQLGYLSGGNIQTITADGTYALRSTLSATSDAQLLRIPRNSAASPREYYYIDLRAAGGAFDTFGASDPAVNGVMIRIGTDPNVLHQSELIDTTPGSRGGFADAPLGVGHTFSDGNVNVTLTSLASGVANVQVQFGTAPPDIYPPTAPSAPRVTDSGGSALYLTWDDASDNLAVVGYHVKRDGRTIATVTDPAYLDTSAARGQAYRYSIEAFDEAGNATTGPETVGALPSAPAPAPPSSTGSTSSGYGDDDTTDPAVRFRSPGSGAHLRRRAVIKTIARDRGGIAKLELYVDGRRRAVSRTTKLDYAWALRRVKPGKHRLTIVARDEAGNRASRSRTVRVVRQR